MDRTSTLVPYAIVVRALMAITIALNIALIAALLNQRSTVQDFVAGRASIGDVGQSDDSASLLSHLSMAAFVLTAVAYAVWFYLARRNVEHYQPHFQRRGRGWALGGWLPIVSLWVPYQVTTDILLDSRQSLLGPVNVQRRSFAVVNLWWAAWLARYATFLIRRTMHDNTPQQFEKVVVAEIVGAVSVIIAAVLAILVVGAITNAQRERRAEWDAELVV